MPSLYEINLQREILREKSAEILADYIRFFNKNEHFIIVYNDK